MILIDKNKNTILIDELDLNLTIRNMLGIYANDIKKHRTLKDLIDEIRKFIKNETNIK